MSKDKGKKGGQRANTSAVTQAESSANAQSASAPQATVDPGNPATYCKWDGALQPVGSKRCNPVTQKVTVCKGNDRWEDSDEDCPPGGYVGNVS